MERLNNSHRTVINDMKREVKSLNRFLTEEMIDEMSVTELLARTHPIYRPGHEQALKINKDDNRKRITQF